MKKKSPACRKLKNYLIVGAIEKKRNR